MLKGHETTNGGVWMSNKELLDYLNGAEVCACSEATQWVGTRDLYRAWMECPHAAWLRYFYRFASAVTGRSSVQSLRDLYRLGLYTDERGAEHREMTADEARRRLTPRMVK